MRLVVLIIINNLMTRVFESNFLNGKYLGGYSMKLFETPVHCTNFFLVWFDGFSLSGHAEKKSNSILTSSILVRICVHIVVDNIMTGVFKSTVLNCKYFGGFSMNLFSHLSSGGHDEERSKILL